MNISIKLFPIVMMLLLLAACGNKIEPGQTSPGEQRISGLRTAKVTAQNVAGQEIFIGTIESSDRGILAARIDGRVGRLTVKVGDVVKVGQLLLTIDQNTVNDRLSEAQGNKEAAAVRLALTEKTYQRYEKLAKAEAITPQEMDRVAAEREEARQNLQATSAGVAQARTGAGYNHVSAPYSGKIVERLVETGSTVMPGTPLLVIDRIGTPQVRLAIPESLMGQIALGEELQLEIPALNRMMIGQVTEIQPSSDPVTRSFAIKMKLPADANVTPGLFVRARRSTKAGASSALLIPLTALVQRGQLTGVYIVEAKILHFRLIKVGPQIDDKVEVLSGLNAGETIVTSDVQRAESGARVED